MRNVIDFVAWYAIFVAIIVMVAISVPFINYLFLLFLLFVINATTTPDNAKKNHAVIIPFQPRDSIRREKITVAIDANR